MTLASDYWLRRLRPYASRGYLSGWLTERAVVLEQDFTGSRVTLERPRGDLAAHLEEAELGRLDGTGRLTNEEVLRWLMEEPP